MIVFDLICRPAGHVFEAWFGSNEDYHEQRGRGLVQCPLCDAPEVEKAVSAPRVAAKGNQRPINHDAPAATAPLDVDAMKQMLTAMAAAQKRFLEQSEYVGNRFADEARAMHVGDADRRTIHGRATTGEAESLIGEGISIMPLPFPVFEPGQEN